MEKDSRGPILLLSDLDDTIKISHTQSKFVTVYRGLFRSSAFAGMATLYGEITAGHPDSRFFVVSSSPPAIRRRIERFLTLHGFPPAQLTLRDWIRQPSVVKYKLKAIFALLESSTAPLILVGDDTEHDPEIFARAEKKYPARVAARYVRIVRGRELPEGTIGFFTAFDIACAELAAGRLTNAQVLKVGEAVLGVEKPAWLIPWFSLAPPLHFVPFLVRPDEAIVDLWEKIKAKVESIPKRNRKP